MIPLLQKALQPSVFCLELIIMHEFRQIFIHAETKRNFSLACGNNKVVPVGFLFV